MHALCVYTSINTAMTTKLCRICRETKPIDGFHRYAKAKDGHQHYCKKCQIERVILTTDKERAKVRAAAYRKAHPDKVLGWSQKYREANREKQRAYAIAYYQAHRLERIAAQQASRKRLKAAKLALLEAAASLP